MWNDRAHFYRLAATAVQHAVVDHVRKRLSQKRGGGADALRPILRFARWFEETRTCSCSGICWTTSRGRAPKG